MFSYVVLFSVFHNKNKEREVMCGIKQLFQNESLSDIHQKKYEINYGVF